MFLSWFVNIIVFFFWSILISASLFTLWFLKHCITAPNCTFWQKGLYEFGMAIIVGIYLFAIGVILKDKGWWFRKKSKSPVQINHGTMTEFEE